MINERLFGSPIPPEVKKKLEDRQRVAGEVAAGESIEAVYPDKNGNNQADLSSRTPFVRMWTSVKLIDPSEIENALEQITKHRRASEYSYQSTSTVQHVRLAMSTDTVRVRKIKGGPNPIDGLLYQERPVTKNVHSGIQDFQISGLEAFQTNDDGE